MNDTNDIEQLATRRAEKFRTSIMAEANRELLPPGVGDRVPVPASDRNCMPTRAAWNAVWRVLSFLLVAHFRREIEAERRAGTIAHRGGG